jgi:hypothetical protein
MNRYLSARSRLTLLYTSLFAVGGGALVLITYLLVAHSLHNTNSTGIPPVSRPAIDRCIKSVQGAGSSVAGGKIK